ncbi:MAG: hypothetical protein JSV52_10125 [Candidatus Zixiibacteriota bacterium]|nr:MAG: hypothetical protein JSV52_10125 [candidate division Zixibacteria bacterium]
MKKMLILVLVAAIAFIIGCSKTTVPGETETFELSSDGYRGISVGNCVQSEADEICRDLGWTRAVGWDCRTVPVNSALGYWEQDVMFSVTCWRPLQ